MTYQQVNKLARCGGMMVDRYIKPENTILEYTAVTTCSQRFKRGGSSDLMSLKSAEAILGFFKFLPTKLALKKLLVRIQPPCQNLIKTEEKRLCII